MPTSDRVAAYLSDSGLADVATALPAISTTLVQREVLQPTIGTGSVYRFAVDLLRLWIVRHREQGMEVAMMHTA